MQILKILILLLASAVLCSCTGEKELEEDADNYQVQSEEIGREAAQMIKTPMEKAQGAVEQENDRQRQMEERLRD